MQYHGYCNSYKYLRDALTRASGLLACGFTHHLSVTKDESYGWVVEWYEPIT